MADAAGMQWGRVARRIRVPLGFVFAVLYFWLARPTWRFLAFGAILILPGLLIRALASGHVRKNEALATSGLYAYTRNPLYFGSLLMGVGFAVAARSWWVGVALVVMFLAIYLPVIRDEEAYLRGKFPEFEEYARRVPRMFPRFTPLRSDDGGSGFSLALYLKHREYNALIGCTLLAGALVLKMTVPETRFAVRCLSAPSSSMSMVGILRLRFRPPGADENFAQADSAKGRRGTYFFANNSLAWLNSGRVELPPSHVFSNSA
jgi:protein-S-isoprenylcysteine O-methyltransferase Ste14